MRPARLASPQRRRGSHAGQRRLCSQLGCAQLQAAVGARDAKGPRAAFNCAMEALRSLAAEEDAAAAAAAGLDGDPPDPGASPDWRPRGGPAAALRRVRLVQGEGGGVPP